MCKVYVAMSKLVLGARPLGWEMYTEKGIFEATDHQVKQMILAGTKICGLKVGNSGELELDYDGFYTTNMMVHSHIGSWKPMNEDSVANLLYVCIGKHTQNDSTVYDCISNRWERISLEESEMKTYLKLGIVSGGAKLDGEKIVLADLEYPKADKKEPVKVEKVETVEPVKVVEPVSEEKKDAGAEKANITKRN